MWFERSVNGCCFFRNDTAIALNLTQRCRHKLCLRLLAISIMYAGLLAWARCHEHLTVRPCTHENVVLGLDSPLQAQARWLSTAKDATEAEAQLRHLPPRRTITHPVQIPVAKVLEGLDTCLMTFVSISGSAFVSQAQLAYLSDLLNRRSR